ASHEADAAGHAADTDDAATGPRSHSGSERRNEEERCPDVAREHLVERADVACEALYVGGVAKVRGDEAGLAPSGGDFPHRLGAAGGIAAVNKDLGPVAGQ